MKRLFCLVLSLLLLHVAHATPQWRIIDQDSELSFTATYDGVPFDGIFERFSVQLRFDPTNLIDTKLESIIDITSVNTNSHDRDEALSEPDWFYFRKFTQATFTSSSITKVDNTTFRVTGLLTIRDKQQKISFPFKWQQKNEKLAQVSAQFGLDRRDFNIGRGDWAQDETIGFAVVVKISLLLELTL